MVTDAVVSEGCAVALNETIRSLVAQVADQITGSIAVSGTEPLDGDETAKIGGLLTLELDLRQGNITPDEYEEALKEVLV
jgi:hypothetical protein